MEGVKVNRFQKTILVFCLASVVFFLCFVLIWVCAYSGNGAAHFFHMNVLLGKKGLSDDEGIILSAGDSEEFSFVSFEPFDDLPVYVKAYEKSF